MLLGRLPWCCTLLLIDLRNPHPSSMGRFEDMASMGYLNDVLPRKSYISQGGFSMGRVPGTRLAGC